MKKGQSILGILFFALLFGLCFQQNALNVEAKTRVIHKDITPKEAASSDLKVIKKVTKLAAHRWIQSYTMDSKYYYYIQMTSPYTWKSAYHESKIQRTGTLHKRPHGFEKIWTCHKS
ncbi:MAG: hypothetical protein ACLVIY_01940 [Anaerobutyricum soehngenii]